MAKQKKSDTVSVYQLKVTLTDIHPPIWRRFKVISNITLHRLHLILQAVMGWENYHCYEFIIDGISYGEPDDELGFEMKEARRFKLNQLVKSEKQFSYNYDFGDDWNHDIQVEKIHQPKLRAQYPYCSEGEHACPPEDCGGVSGYEELLEIINDPEHEEYEDTWTWVGKDFDPEAFNLKSINRELVYHRQKGNNPLLSLTRVGLQPAIFPTINRLVAIIKPKIAFYRWLAISDLSLGITLEELRQDCTAILIPEFGSNEEGMEYIEKMYERIFDMKLESWIPDTKAWPKNRNLNLFREWFEVEIHSEIWDSLGEEIQREIL